MPHHVSCEQYLQELREAPFKRDFAVLAFVLTTNHVHLLATPSSAGTISPMMQAIGHCHVGCFNALHWRTGILWEGRFKAALIDSQRYQMGCYRYRRTQPRSRRHDHLAEEIPMVELRAPLLGDSGSR